MPENPPKIFHFPNTKRKYILVNRLHITIMSASVNKQRWFILFSLIIMEFRDFLIV